MEELTIAVVRMENLKVNILFKFENGIIFQ